MVNFMRVSCWYYLRIPYGIHPKSISRWRALITLGLAVNSSSKDMIYLAVK